MAQSKTGEIEVLQKLKSDLKDAKADLTPKYESAIDCRDKADSLGKDIDDCEIPVNIKLRRNEVDQFCERLDRIKQEFRDIKQADADFEGTAGSEKKIKEAIK